MGPITAIWRGEIPDIHFSNRYLRDRNFRFHVCEVRLPEVDLHTPKGLVEQALAGRGKQLLWLPGSRLNDPTIQFSPTMPAVRPSVLGLISPQTFGKLRQSEGGIALIQRSVGGHREWLAQWNENWGQFFFIGGHRRGSESFRDCVIREIGEELGLPAAEFTVGAKVAHHLKYPAISGSADELTEYTMELFDAQLKPSAQEAVERSSRNKWLSEAEIRRLEANDARPVSVTMMLLLSLAGLI
jgi:8-oxo-dGTP pyrophosphatase MutT (NUDIX family)